MVRRPRIGRVDAPADRSADSARPLPQGVYSDCAASMIASKKAILGLGVAKFVQNTLFFCLYYSVYVKPLPADVCEGTWNALGLQSLDCGPLLGSAVIFYLIGVALDSFGVFLVGFIVRPRPCAASASWIG